MTRNLVNLAIWFLLFTAVTYAWTGALAVAAVAGAVGAALIAALSIRVATRPDGE